MGCYMGMAISSLCLEDNRLTNSSTLDLSFFLNRFLMPEGRTFLEGPRGAFGCARWPINMSEQSHEVRTRETYEWVATVATDGNLRFVGVDEDLRVASSATTALACNNATVCPLYGNLVNKHHR